MKEDDKSYQPAISFARTDSSETPSEARAREEVEDLLRHRRFAGECAWFVDGPCTCGASAWLDAYRAAVLREADRETVRLVEALRARVVHARPCNDTGCTHATCVMVRDADTWLAARGKGE